MKILFPLFAVIMLAVIPRQSIAATVITNGSDIELRAAMTNCGTVRFNFDGVITLTNAITVTCAVALDATGHAVTLSGGNSNRIFNVLPGASLTLTNITLANGRSTNGGAIYSEGTVVAQGCQFLSNAAMGASGTNGTNGPNGVSSFTGSQVTSGAPGQDGGPGQDAAGGAIYNLGTLELTACSFVNAAATAGKGGKGGNGGNAGQVIGGGGVRAGNGGNGGSPGAAGSARGGSIASFGTLLVRSCVFSNSIAFGGEGGGGGTMGTKFNATFNPTNNGTPFPTNGLSRTGAIGGVVQGGAVFSAGSCFISNSFFFTNAAFGGLGGTGAVLPTCLDFQPGLGGKGGQAEGGAIFIATNSLTARFADCTFAANRSAGGNGGSSGTYMNVSPNGCGFVFVHGADGGDASGGGVSAYGECLVVRCLLLSNKTVGGNGSLADEWGGDGGPRGGTGGTAFGGAICVASNGAFINCTFTMNIAVGGSGGAGGNPRNAFFPSVNGGNGGNAFGGGLFAAANSALTNFTFDHNTVIRGSATTNASSPSRNGVLGNSYGGSIANTSGVIQIANTIIAFGSDSNSFGNITDLGHNISSDTTPAWTSETSLSNTDPLLLPLANNGGPTLTMALRAGSPALNAADCSSAPVTDQRGYARPSGPGCDIGAYEGPGTTSLLIIRQNSSTNVLRWLADAGQIYRLEITTDFSGWIPYATNTAGASGLLDFPIPANLSPQFFRLTAQ